MAAGPATAPGQHDLSLGEELHNSVTAERWCVTRRDLRHLRKKVCKALKHGQITPTDRDAFDPQDRRFGPTIYTVTDQLVKPITAQAGGMSWALMRHPKGKMCDVFITHAWQEGIFEFVDKVLASWPRGAKNAWCCMLAIPQNLRIAELISTPSASPFARALAFAPYMLVVPNRTGSIYTRLWCVYEAFLAYQWDKVVITAKRPSRWKEWRAMPLVVLCMCGGGALSSLLHLSESCLVATIAMFASYLVILASMLCTQPRLWRAVNYFGSIWAGGYFIALHSMPAHALEDTCFGEYEDYEEWRTWQMFYSVSMALFLAFSEVDRVRYEGAQRESDELRKGYTGSVRDASCSSADDAASIRAEIDGCSDEVDRTVQVLTSAGMSTASLREAAERGVDLEMFSTSSIAFRAIVVGRPGKNTSSTPHHDHLLLAVSITNLLLGLIWIIIQITGRRDVQTWSYLVAQKTIVVGVWPLILLVLALWVGGALPTTQMLLLVEIWSSFGWLLVVLLSWAHINRVARLPWIGRRLAQFYAARSPGALRKVWAPAKGQPCGSTSSASSASSPEETEFSSTDESQNSSGARDAAAAPSRSLWPSPSL